MALFSRSKKEEQPASIRGESTRGGKEVATVAATVAHKPLAQASLSHVLRHARITEKAGMHQAQSVYTFDISEKATKRDIMHAVKSLYGVSPRKVAVVTVPSKMKRNMRTGRAGVKKGGRKAYVYLKKGDTITIA